MFLYWSRMEPGLVFPKRTWRDAHLERLQNKNEPLTLDLLYAFLFFYILVNMAHSKMSGRLTGYQRKERKEISHQDDPFKSFSMQICDTDTRVTQSREHSIQPVLFNSKL